MLLLQTWFRLGQRKTELVVIFAFSFFTFVKKESAPSHKFYLVQLFMDIC